MSTAAFDLGRNLAFQKSATPGAGKAVSTGLEMAGRALWRGAKAIPGKVWSATKAAPGKIKAWGKDVITLNKTHGDVAKGVLKGGRNVARTAGNTNPINYARSVKAPMSQPMGNIRAMYEGARAGWNPQSARGVYKGVRGSGFQQGMFQHSRTAADWARRHPLMAGAGASVALPGVYGDAAATALAPGTMLGSYGASHVPGLNWMNPYSSVGQWGSAPADPNQAAPDPTYLQIGDDGQQRPMTEEEYRRHLWEIMSNSNNQVQVSGSNGETGNYMGNQMAQLVAAGGGQRPTEDVGFFGGAGPEGQNNNISREQLIKILIQALTQRQQGAQPEQVYH